MNKSKHEPERDKLERAASAALHRKEQRRPRHLAPGEFPPDDMKDWQLRGRAWHWRVIDRFLDWFFDRTPDTLIRQFVRAIKRMNYHETNEIMEEISDAVGDIQAQREHEAEQLLRAARRKKEQ